MSLFDDDFGKKKNYIFELPKPIEPIVPEAPSYILDKPEPLNFGNLGGMGRDLMGRGASYNEAKLREDAMILIRPDPSLCRRDDRPDDRPIGLPTVFG